MRKKDLITYKVPEASVKRPSIVLKTIENAFSEGKPERDWLLNQLSGLVNYARVKIADSNTGKVERIKWSRILVSAAMATSHALRDKELDELKEEIKQLKEVIREIEKLE